MFPSTIFYKSSVRDSIAYVREHQSPTHLGFSQHLYFSQYSVMSWLLALFTLLSDLSDRSLRSRIRHNFNSGNTFFEHIFKDRIKKKIIILILKFKSQQSRWVAALTFRDAPDCRPDVFPPFTFTLPPTAAEWLINAHTGRQTRTRQTRVVPPTHPVLIVRMDISLCCRVNTPPLSVCPSAALICVCVCHMALSLPL